MRSKTDLLQGTLDLLILKTLALGPRHGWGIAQRLQQDFGRGAPGESGLPLSGAAPAGAAGPAIVHLGQLGQSNRQAKFYALTGTGRRQLDAETAHWTRMSTAIARVLEATSS